ncbi:hypothetical protein CcaCcLH18_09170 [Colletotrichum camelliae]|nr:hypothetical protein CcaCcLH18_09170 [Colletotrichum camelliae]
MEGSIFSAKNQNTVGLFNTTLDFSLVTINAMPKQYEGLNNALSSKRRENAWKGQHHQTARRLGAIFGGCIPDIEVLSDAYGRRVSEIASSTKLQTEFMDFGPFSDHVGIDGTSILAAVTSGSEHVALHLLACMLAIMHPYPAEATAIWYQIVRCRIAELERKADITQLEGIAAQFAITQGLQITRDDLRAWDASARAWLESANEVKRLDDTQLRLIIKNVPSITSFGSTYADVMKNWSIAMCAVQNAISGSPQEVRNGAVLLGFLSWHIYPDVQIFSPDKLVVFSDDLVKSGGIITLGLESGQNSDGGVRWSLSLSHLRHYGEPVQVERSINDDCRLTLRDLRLIALGSFIHSWIKPESVNIEEAAECLEKTNSNFRTKSNFKKELGLDYPPHPSIM